MVCSAGLSTVEMMNCLLVRFRHEFGVQVDPRYSEHLRQSVQKHPGHEFNPSPSTKSRAPYEGIVPHNINHLIHQSNDYTLRAERYISRVLNHNDSIT